MAKTKKIISAGVLRKEVLYNRVRIKDDRRCRNAKHKAQSEAQARMNAQYSWQKLELMLAANFKPGDLVVVLDYSEYWLPYNREEAGYRLKLFRAAMARARREAGQSFVAVWNHETRHGDGRYHHHLVINSTGADIETLKAAWPYGGVHVEPLRADREKNYETLAGYMCKEYPEKLGKRTWSYTRNCKHPEMETFVVPDDTELVVPEGAVVLEEGKYSNQYTSFHYVKMIAEVLPKAPKAKRRHRRRMRT